MGKLKKALLAIVGTVVGIVTLRKVVGKRGAENTEEELEEITHENPETPIEHAKAAAEHTRRAVQEAKES